MPFTLLGCRLQHHWVVLELHLKLFYCKQKKLQPLHYFFSCFMSSAALFSQSDAFTQTEPGLLVSSSGITF